MMLTETQILENEYELYTDYNQCDYCGDYFSDEGYHCEENGEDFCDECFSETSHDELNCLDFDYEHH